jgi:hypothetical protein
MLRQRAECSGWKVIFLSRQTGPKLELAALIELAESECFMSHYSTLLMREGMTSSRQSTQRSRVGSGMVEPDGGLNCMTIFRSPWTSHVNLTGGLSFETSRKRGMLLSFCAMSIP